MRPRQLRLLRAVEKIELRLCASEGDALALEASLLAELKPPFNRAGTWKPAAAYLSWKTTPQGIELELEPNAPELECCFGPLHGGALWLASSLARVLWCAAVSRKGALGWPAGWATRPIRPPVLIACSAAEAIEATEKLTALLHRGLVDEFVAWVRAANTSPSHPVETQLLEENLEFLIKFLPPRLRREPENSEPAASRRAIPAPDMDQAQGSPGACTMAPPHASN
jgi:hypothetical protein